MDEAVQDRVGDGGVTYPRVPLFEGELARDDGGAKVIAVFEDFEEIVTLSRLECTDTKAR